MKEILCNKPEIRVDSDKHEEVVDVQVDEQVRDEAELGLVDVELLESIEEAVFELALEDDAFSLESTYSCSF